MITVYLDFDNTMVESNKRVIEILNERYGENKSEDDLEDYGYNSIHNITENEKLSIFESDDFFTNLQLKPRILDVVAKNYDKFNWVITTKGTELNLKKKFDWIDKNWPFTMRRVGINNKNLSKASVNMSGGIQIDDVSAALDTKAGVKILYKDYRDYYWQHTNPCDNILIVNDWDEIDKILDFYSNFDIETLEERK